VARSSERAGVPFGSFDCVLVVGFVDDADPAPDGQVCVSGGGAGAVVGVVLPALAERAGVRVDADASLRFVAGVDALRGAGVDAGGAGLTAVSPTTASVSCTGGGVDAAGATESVDVGAAAETATGVVAC